MTSKQTSAQRAAKHRKRMKALGYKRKEFYIPEQAVDKVMAFVFELQRIHVRSRR